MTKLFRITFQMIDHEADDAGYNAPEEFTFIESPCNMTATMEFCNGMTDCTFKILAVEEVK